MLHYILTHDSKVRGLTMECTNELYEECFQRILKVVWDFYKRYQAILSFEDLLSEANYRFVYSWNCYQEERKTAQFTTYMTSAVRNGLCEIVRKELFIRKRRRDLPERPLEERFNVHHMMFCLSDNASQCIQLSVEPNQSMANYCQKKVAQGKSFRPADIRKSLRRYLRDIGWTTKQIIKAFTEIKEALP